MYRIDLFYYGEKVDSIVYEDEKSFQMDVYHFYMSESYGMKLYINDEYVDTIKYMKEMNMPRIMNDSFSKKIEYEKLKNKK